MYATCRPASPRETPITASERDRYSTVWTDVESYRAYSPGERYLPLFRAILDAHTPPHRELSILDAGCGTGRAGAALAADGYHVLLADITREGLAEEARHLPFYECCLWRDMATIRAARRACGVVPWVDWVVCCDVLEHIPPQFTMLTVARLCELSRAGVFLAVSLVPDVSGAWIGEHLHRTVQPFTWWRDSLADIATIREARDLLTNAVFVLDP